MPILPLFFAYRFLKSSTHERSISSMILVCFTAIMLGTFSLALILAIMQGFQEETHKKLQGIHSDIILRAQGKSLAYEKIRAIITEEFSNDIQQVTPYAFGHALIQIGNEADISHPITLIALNPSTESQVTTLAEAVIGENKNLEQLVADKKILMGLSLAQELSTKLGESITLLYVPEEIQKKTITFTSAPAMIGALFKTGIDDIDAHVIFCSFEFFNTLFPEQGIMQLGIKLKPGVHEDPVIKLLKERFHLQVFSWKDLYAPLVSALILEKYAMFFIILLVTLIACMNSISLLFMIITQKQTDIAILRVMGMKLSLITRIFMVLGSLITVIAATIGIFLAWITALLLERYPFIKLPDVYYVDHLPAHLTLGAVVIVMGSVCVISFIATLLPLQRIKKLSITHILKFES